MTLNGSLFFAPQTPLPFFSRSVLPSHCTFKGECEFSWLQQITLFLTDRTSCLILGGGLAGLSAAYHLKSDYILCEASDEFGGAARSFTRNGFTFDLAIHILFSSDPEATALIHKILGKNFVTSKRSSWIYSKNSYTRYPYQANMFGLPQEVVRENVNGYLNAFFDRADAPPPRNFEEWIHWMYGGGIAKNFMLPFNRKVWAYELDRMSSAWLDGRVPLPGPLDILRGAFEENPNSYGPNHEFWYPRTGGIGSLATSLASRLEYLHSNMRCRSIDLQTRIARFTDGREIEFEHLISTIPLPKLITLLNAPPIVQAVTERLRFNKVVTVNLGIARESISDKHWIYFPEDEFLFQRVSFPMNLAEKMAPDGTSSILAEISLRATEAVDTERMIDQTISGLIHAEILREDDSLLVREARVIDPAYVIPDLDHEENTKRIHAYLDSVEIISCGRFGAWQYLNMDHALLSGKRAAERVDRRVPDLQITV